MSFQKTVIIIATVILISLLIFVGYAIQKAQIEQEFPPVIGACPDYWDASNNECINTESLGSCNLDTPKNFDVVTYTGDTGNCNKFIWANDCNVSWGGITNNNTLYNSALCT